MKEASSLIFYYPYTSEAKNRLTVGHDIQHSRDPRGDLEGAVLSSPAIYKSKYYDLMTEILYVSTLIYSKG